MRLLNYKLILLISFIYVTEMSLAHVNPLKKQKSQQAASFRNDCAPSRAEIDLAVNNVRARLQVGGDLFWDFSNGKYVVPNHDPALGLDDVSSIFAAGVWMGGMLQGDVPSLKLAAQDYRDGSDVDFYPGPLRDDDGSTNAQRCREWDRFFHVEGDSIRKHIENYLFYKQQGIPYPPDKIPADVKAWPAMGNPFFSEFYDFDLPSADQGLGNYHNADDDPDYDPSKGDYPVIRIRRCLDPTFADDMYFFIYNDEGNVHRLSGGEKIRMEIQVQAFGFRTQNEINDMTFYRYKLINRAPETIDDFYFAMWVDADLGCPDDDFIGCDTASSLMYVYNQDLEDGREGSSCVVDGSIINTYGVDVPILGVDYFQGPRSEPRLQPDGSYAKEELGMTSFTYYNRGESNPPQGMRDPQFPFEYYNLLQGFWKDGTPYTSSGSGYMTPGSVVRYAFVDPPEMNGGWSMCEAMLDFDDRRTLQATGPLRLETGALEELIVGVVWLPEANYPCPSLEALLIADQTAQSLFDLCFDVLDGPTAPNMYSVELDQQVVFTLVNSEGSNNANLAYIEIDPSLAGVEGVLDSQYRFQGYRVYQLANAGVKANQQSFDNVDLAREIFQFDVLDSVIRIYNWESIENPLDLAPIYMPVEKVVGLNQGIRHSFTVTNDAFASGQDTRLVNFKKYYYTVMAYGYNNFRDFEVTDGSGQDNAYLVGRHNNTEYIVVPRKTIDLNINSAYDESIEVTRLDGDGVLNNALEIANETREDIIRNGSTDELTWIPGRSPLNAKVYDPVNLVDGEYLLSFHDFDADPLLDTTRFTVRNESTGEILYAAETDLATLNEELIHSIGISVFFAQDVAPGTHPSQDESNGFLASSMRYEENSASNWYRPVEEGQEEIYNFIKNETINEYDYNLDPNQVFSGQVQTGFYPFLLTAFDTNGGYFDTESSVLYSPSWFHPHASNVRKTHDGLSNLNNVDIVFTSNKDLWSKCVIVQTANYATNRYIDDFSKNMNVLQRPSVDKIAKPNDETTPAELNDGTVGYGYFPGYAIDVETGKRLNIFFGENTAFRPDNPAFEGLFNAELLTGDDRMWNPGSLTGDDSVDESVSGSQHYIFVTTLEYDGCQVIHDSLLAADRAPSHLESAFRTNILKFVSWAGFPLIELAESLTSYGDGLIPNDLAISLRVKSPFRKREYTGRNGGFNQYRLSVRGMASTAYNNEEVESVLDLINVVPNPYYAYSSYENSSTDNIVKITNLPQVCTVSIFSLDGKFIRKYDQNAVASEIPLNNAPIPNTQFQTDIEWDLKNDDGIPIAGGVYFIHVKAPGIGERIIKWFGVNRKFNPSGLN